ncbi:MAG: putative zinc-binding protein [Betaproteobacteria bacterium]
MAESCACSAAPKLIFACSGAADVGEVSDRAARQLTRAGVGKMYCLAGIGGDIPGILEQTGLASALLAIDGCPTGCVSASLKRAGFRNFTTLQLADLGLNKGTSPASAENIERVVTAAREQFQ